MRWAFGNPSASKNRAARTRPDLDSSRRLPITVVCSACVDTAATSCLGRGARSKSALLAMTRRSATAAAIPGPTTRRCLCVAFGLDAITGLVTSRP